MWITWAQIGGQYLNFAVFRQGYTVYPQAVDGGHFETALREQIRWIGRSHLMHRAYTGATQGAARAAFTGLERHRVRAMPTSGRKWRPRLSRVLRVFVRTLASGLWCAKIYKPIDRDYHRTGQHIICPPPLRPQKVG